MASLVNPSQIDDAVGVGWSPTSDVLGPQDPGTVPRQEECLQVLRDGGQAVSGRLEQLIAVIQCDSAWLFAGSLERVADGSGDAFIAVVRGLGEVPAASTFTGLFDAQRMGAAAYQPFAFDVGCGCFVYSALPAPIP